VFGELQNIECLAVDNHVALGKFDEQEQFLAGIWHHEAGVAFQFELFMVSKQL
jgi:hypothetical protein